MNVSMNNCPWSCLDPSIRMIHSFWRLVSGLVVVNDPVFLMMVIQLPLHIVMVLQEW